jgi:hypothetical protein
MLLFAKTVRNSYMGLSGNLPPAVEIHETSAVGR